MELKSSSKWATLTVAGSAQFLVLLESTVITVAIPDIGSHLGDDGWLPWVLSGYLLAFGGLLLPGGVWADRFGQRRIFFTGLTGFAISSVLCALAPSISLLVGARALQGAAAGVLAASALGVVLTRYEAERERAVAMTVWSTLGVIGAVVGSLAAGPVIAWLGWPGVFWINIAAVAVLFPFAWRSIQLTHQDKTGSAPPVTAALVAALGAATVLAGLSISEVRPIPGVIVAVVGVTIIVAVFRHQLTASRPILPVQLFRSPAYRVAAAGLFLANGLMVATMFAYSQHLQNGYLLTAQTASFAVLPMALASLVVAFTTDSLIARLGEQAVLRIGAGFLLGGSLSFLLVTTASVSWGYLVVAGILVGAGMPACFVVLNRRAFSSVPAALSGAASGFTNTVTTLGGATVVALTALGSVFAQQIGAYTVLAITAALIGVLAMSRSGTASTTSD